MPIIKLEQDYEFGAGLPCIGRIRKGGPKIDAKRPGPDLKYFRFTPEPGFERVTPVFQQLYGEQPAHFTPVRFAGAITEDVFSYWNMAHTASKLMHKCDGEVQARHFDAATGEYSSDPLACESPGCGCKNTGRVKLFMPQLINEIGTFGYVMLTTTSIWDIRNLLNCFKDLERIVGDLSSVDFLIGRAGRIITAPMPKPKTQAEADKFRRTHNGKDWQPGERMNITKSLIYIRPNEAYTKQVLLASVSSAPQLPAPEATTSRTATGQARNERRIGAPPAPPPIDDDQDDDDHDGESAPEWLNEGLKWVKDNFEMGSNAINDALTFAGDWQSDKNIFKAAIVAASCTYDLTLIEQATSKHFTVEIYDAALRIVEARAATLQPVIADE